VRQLPRINPAFRALPTRDAAFPCKLQLSTAKREEVRPSASGELYLRVVIVTNMARRAENVVACSSKDGTCDQWIKEEKGAIKWIQFVRRQRRLSSAACAACSLGNFLRTLATPEPIRTDR
jgi:hypothetical protein